MSWFKPKLNPHEWRKAPEPGPWQGLGQTWNYVDTVTGRIDDAQITKRSDENYYVVWVRGASYGHYGTIEDAFRAAEETCKRRKIA